MNKQIAIVEDDSKYCDILATHFRFRGFECHSYHDSKSAIEDLITRKRLGSIDGIVMDLELPGSEEQGGQLIEHFRLNGYEKPIIVLTANQTDETELHNLDNGADDYLRKPHAFSVLFKRFEKLWARSKANERFLSHDAIALDLVSNKVRYRGRSSEEALEEPTAKLLKCLLGRPGSVFAMDQLEESMRTVGKEYKPGYVRSHISKLNACFESLGLKDAIRNDRGIGYALGDCN